MIKYRIYPPPYDATLLLVALLVSGERVCWSVQPDQHTPSANKHPSMIISGFSSPSL